jgi:hypothetical protein
MPATRFALFRIYRHPIAAPVAVGDHDWIWLRSPAALSRPGPVPSPSKQRVQGMPGARCTRGLVRKVDKRKRTRAYRSAEAIRHSLRNGFTAYAVLTPATNSSCHRLRIKTCPSPIGPTRLPRLDISNGCQAHTVLPYASVPVVCMPPIAHGPFANPPCHRVSRPTLPRPPHPIPRS